MMRSQRTHHKFPKHNARSASDQLARSPGCTTGPSSTRRSNRWTSWFEDIVRILNYPFWLSCMSGKLRTSVALHRPARNIWFDPIKMPDRSLGSQGMLSSRFVGVLCMWGHIECYFWTTTSTCICWLKSLCIYHEDLVNLCNAVRVDICIWRAKLESS